ncbi:glycoside hydrolase family 130 protein [bacterium]|nr:glycoside hydrolase family 130 protein [bacterium]
MIRHKKNPLITPHMVAPTVPELEVMGAFNAGATVYRDQVILLVRISERCKVEPGGIGVPLYRFEDSRSRLEIARFKHGDPDVQLKDTRGVVYKGIDYLSTLSTIRVARSADGINFSVDAQPLLYPCTPSEQYGCEDARVVKIEGEYYINYTAISRDGWATALCTTQDFKSVFRKGIIFYPPNKDVCLFPEKIRGRYWALHRPHNEGFGKPSIWISSSPNLLDWGEHQCLIRPRNNEWERIKIGGGAAPIKTDKGWLEICHGKGDNSVYYLFTLLLDLEDPARVVARGEKPFLAPEEDYETSGFFPNIVFSNGLVERPNGEIYLYYGACDETTNLIITSVDELLADLNT